MAAHCGCWVRLRLDQQVKSATSLRHRIFLFPSFLSGFPTFIPPSLLSILKPLGQGYSNMLRFCHMWRAIKNKHHLPETVPQLSTASNIHHGKQAYTQVQLCRPGLEVHNKIRPTLVVCNDRAAKPAKRAMLMYNSNGVLLWKVG